MGGDDGADAKRERLRVPPPVLACVVCLALAAGATTVVTKTSLEVLAIEQAATMRTTMTSTLAYAGLNERLNNAPHNGRVAVVLRGLPFAARPPGIDTKGKGPPMAMPAIG